MIYHIRISLFYYHLVLTFCLDVPTIQGILYFHDQENGSIFKIKQRQYLLLFVQYQVVSAEPDHCIFQINAQKDN
jgi:hypothetical protein